MRRKLFAIIFALAIWLTISAGARSFAARSSAARQRQESAAIQSQMKPREIPPEISRHVQTLHSKLQPSASAWVEQQARIESRKQAPDAASIAAAARNRFPALAAGGGSMYAGDIDSLVMLVMMQSANDAEKDLQDAMAQMQAVNNAKQQMRNLLSQTKLEIESNTTQVDKTPCQTALCKSIPATLGEISNATANLQKPVRIAVPAKLTFADLRTLPTQLQSNLDNMNEMSEMTSMRLQMLMDRRSKLIEALSNIMKKIDDTNSSILQNIK